MGMSSYQKLKYENKKLISDLYHLVNFPDTQRSFVIKMIWKTKKQIEEAVMAGSPIKQ